MRGSPLVQALIAFFVILLAGLPLRRLTRADEAPAPALPQASAEPLKAVHLQLAFTRPATSVRVLHLGELVWKSNGPVSEAACDLRVPFPKEGIELEFEIAWPTDGLCAMRARLTDPHGRELERSVWGRGEVGEVATFAGAE